MIALRAESLSLQGISRAEILRTLQAEYPPE